MVEFGVLRCPLCDAIRLCPDDQFDKRTELKDGASEHRQSHRLDESKHGIFRVMMVRELERSADMPTQQWTDEPNSISA